MPSETSAEIGLAFHDPVGGSQRAFRRLLLAMSQPGTVVDFPGEDLAAAEPGLPLGPAATAVALTLVDMESPVWLGDGCRDAAGYLRFHCGARIVPPEACRFAFARAGAPLPMLDSFDLGSAEFPDRSTTLVLEADHLHGGGALTLRGPGIDGVARFAAGGVGADFWRQRQELRPLFPLGIDLILTCGRQIAALPRTTSVEF